MRKDYVKYMVGLACCSLICLTSCEDDKDLGGKMDEMITMSSIVIGETRYDAGSNTICLLKNQELKLDWTIKPEHATDKKIEWASSDESVATVTQDGKVTTKDKVGEAIISLTPIIGFGPEATIVTRTVKVLGEFTFISSMNITDVPSEAIAVGDNHQLKVTSQPATATFQRYKWMSSNPEIATVDEQTGLVTGVGKGDVTISVTADDLNQTPVSSSCSMSVKVIVPITELTFAEDTELAELGYGQEYQIKYTLAPADATASLLSWTSDKPEVISVDKTGKVTVKTMTQGSVIITASYGKIARTIEVKVAEGRLWYSLGDGLGSWFLDGNKASVLSSDGNKTTVQMGPGYRGDLWLSKSGSGKSVYMTPSVYRYLAVKVGFKSKLEAGKNKPNGCVKFEIFDNGISKIGPEYWGTGGDANNRYQILGNSEFLTNEPNVLYYDLQSRYKTVTPTDWNQTFELVQCKFIIADFPEIAQTYDLYWIRTFKTVEELQAFVNSENKTNE